MSGYDIMSGVANTKSQTCSCCDVAEKFLLGIQQQSLYSYHIFRHDIAEILLKVALNTIKSNQILPYIYKQRSSK